MEEKKYDKDLGKYVITETIEKVNKGEIKTLKYKDIDLNVSEALQDYIKTLNKKQLELENSIAYLTEERRKKMEELDHLKKVFESITSSMNIEYAKTEIVYQRYEDLVHKKALIQ